MRRLLAGLLLLAAGCSDANDPLPVSPGAPTSPPQFVTQWGSIGYGMENLRYPDGIAITPGGRVHVTDTFSHRIQEFTAGGFYVGEWGSFGWGGGQFNRPMGIAVDAAGQIYVTDSNNHRVEKFAYLP